MKQTTTKTKLLSKLASVKKRNNLGMSYHEYKHAENV